MIFQKDFILPLSDHGIILSMANLLLALWVANVGQPSSSVELGVNCVNLVGCSVNIHGDYSLDPIFVGADG